MNFAMHSLTHAPLEADEVHVWRVPLEQSHAKGIEDVLSSDEHARAERFRLGTPRWEFVATRTMLRHILSAYTGEDARQLRFCYGERGKPWLQDAPELHFNLAHSGGRAVIAVARGPVGVDMEAIQPGFAWEEIVVRFFSPLERCWIQAQSETRRTEAFFRCWTRREAYLKARGMGVAVEAVSISMTTPDDPVISDDAGQWSIWSFNPFPDCIGALAIKDGKRRLRLLDMDHVGNRQFFQHVPGADRTTSIMRVTQW